MKILAIDTSAAAVSAAVVDDSKILAEDYLNIGLTHSQTLLPLIDSVLKNANITMGDMDLLVTSNGPGSFTGVRIGVSTIKGMGLAAGLPCVGVSTLEALAYNFLGLPVLVSAVMDARREQVYNAVFELKTDNTVHRLTPDRAISISDLGEELLKYDQPIYFLGDGADLCYNVLRESRNRFLLAPAHLRFQRAASVAVLGKRIFESGSELYTAAQLLPSYLRLSQAERELKQRNLLKK